MAGINYIYVEDMPAPKPSLPERILRRPGAKATEDPMETPRHADIRSVRNSECFDAEYYLERYPDVKRAGADPAWHYLHHGWKEGRDPSADFHTRFYLETYPDAAAAGMNPLHHYATIGQAAGYRTSADAPLRAWLEEEVKIIAASGLFDEEYYRAAHPRIPPGVTDLVGHYCQWGWRKGSDPSENFHSRFYLTRHPDVRKSGMNPLLHYISSGAAESRPCQDRSNPWHEDPSYFRQTDADIRLVAFHAGTEWTESTSPAPARHRASPALEIAEAAKTARSHGISAWCFTRDASSPTPPGSYIEKLLSDPRIDIGFLIALDLRRETLHENTLETLQRAFRDNRYQTFGEQPVLLLVLPPEPNGITATMAKLTGLTGAGQRSQPFLIARTDEASPEQPDAWSTLGIQATLDWPHDRHLRSEGMYAPRTIQGASTIPYRVIAGQSMATIYHGRRGPMPCYRVVNVGQDGWDGRSKRCIRYTRFNLPDYRQWLEAAIEETRDTLPADRRMVFIDAWNEHHRGAVLEPDPELGHGKLNETVRTLLRLPKDRPCPPVSVVVPGSAPTACLRQRLACIYGQTYLNCEVLLVDDGASAETTALFEACVQRHTSRDHPYPTCLRHRQRLPPMGRRHTVRQGSIHLDRRRPGASLQRLSGTDASLLH
jgi:hypothetical protein